MFNKKLRSIAIRINLCITLQIIQETSLTSIQFVQCWHCASRDVVALDAEHIEGVRESFFGLHLKFLDIF